jgi:hypothetical protein
MTPEDERLCVVAVDRRGRVVGIGEPDPAWLMEMLDCGHSIHPCSVAHARQMVLGEPWRAEDA